MSTDRIALRDVLDREEVEAIDRFCADHPGVESLAALADFLREQFSVELTVDPDIVTGFATDQSNLPGRASGLFRPKSARDCAICLRACFSGGLPVTITAGRSNLTGSATPEGGVLLSTVNLASPPPVVDKGAMTVTTPVGTPLQELRELILKQSDRELLFPVDPTSREDLAVGGGIACNASGFTPGEAGSMRGWVVAMDFLLPNGLAVQATRGQYVSTDGRFLLRHGDDEQELPVPTHPRAALKNAGGPFSSADGVLDFIDLVVGSEGLFGLVTACTLKLQPRPADYLDLFFSLPAEANALAFRDYLVKRLEGGLGGLSALEYFGVNCRPFMDHEQQLFHGDHQVAVYVQVPLPNRSAEDAAEEWFDILVESDCGIDEDAVMLLDNDRDRKIFFEARHSLPANSLEVVQRRGTYTIMTDTVVPPEHFAEYLEYTHGLVRAEKLDYLTFGHLGDCHLHVMILPEKEQLARATEVYDMIVARSAELGGVYSGEHGTGKRKRQDFLRCHGPGAVEQVRRCKAAVDPQFLLNRGNVIADNGGAS